MNKAGSGNVSDYHMAGLLRLRPVYYNTDGLDQNIVIRNTPRFFKNN